MKTKQDISLEDTKQKILEIYNAIGIDGFWRNALGISSLRFMYRGKLLCSPTTTTSLTLPLYFAKLCWIVQSTPKKKIQEKQYETVEQYRRTLTDSIGLSKVKLLSTLYGQYSKELEDEYYA